MEHYRSTAEVAAQTNISAITAQLWAGKNGVAFSGRGKRKNYLWTDTDITRFRGRNTKRGRPAADDSRKSRPVSTGVLVSFLIDPALFGRLPSDDVNEFINAAIREKLDGGRSLAAAAAILGTARSERKAASSRLNGFAPCGPGKRRGRPKKRDVPADRGRGEDGS